MTSCVSRLEKLWQAWICILQNHYYLVVEEFGDVREELKAEVQLYGFRQDTRRHAAASVPAHLTGLRPQSHLDQDRTDVHARAHTQNRQHETLIG